MVTFKITAIMLFGMIGSPILASAAEPSTCDAFDVRCTVSTSTWSGSLIVPEASTPSSHAQPPSLCLKISRSLNAIPGTRDGDGCVQIVGIIDKSSILQGAVSGHYCSSNGVVNLLRVMPDSPIELQPDMLIGTVSGAGDGGVTLNTIIRGQIYLKESNNPDEGYSKGPGFKLSLADGCPSN